MPKITIKDIARLCNCSISTVSRAINNDPTINADTRDRVLQVAKAMNYVPNNSARQLKVSETNRIALLIKGVDNPFFQSMIPLFEKKFRDRGEDFVLHSIAEDQEEVEEGLLVAKEKRLKGLIFLGGRIENPDLAFQHMETPFVLCSVATNVPAYGSKCSAVSVDDEKEAFRAVDYLIKKGHRRIAILTGKQSDRTVGALRLAGYRRALEQNQIPFDPKLVFFMDDKLPEYSEENGYVTGRAMMASGQDFTAIFVISDRTAIGLFKAIDDAGKRIPEDISVIGFDGIEMGAYMIPSLTTMVQPIEKMVDTCIELLDRQIAGDEKKEQVLYETTIEERESVQEVRDGGSY